MFFQHAPCTVRSKRGKESLIPLHLFEKVVDYMTKGPRSKIDRQSYPGILNLPTVPYLPEKLKVQADRTHRVLISDWSAYFRIKNETKRSWNITKFVDHIFFDIVTSLNFMMTENSTVNTCTMQFLHAAVTWQETKVYKETRYINLNIRWTREDIGM